MHRVACPLYWLVILAVLTWGMPFSHLQAADSRVAPQADPKAKPPEVNPPGAAEPSSPDEWYGAGVRPTEARTPEEERAGFHLPPGFEVRLFAAEPEIKKPMNLSFDPSGRLWVTDTLEYPYPAPEGQPGRDSVRILEDTDGDGRADRVTTFAEDLNIPIGILPYGDGCICYSIPNLWYLRDTDDDGKCDRRELLVGPFDTSRDTHGMVNSLRAGADGWIYACHGFNNHSRVSGSDGHEITLVSGNTFRFLPDGSRIEHVSWGQVNPFGVALDDWGYFYSADCHSKPISQLIRGGYYPSFGRPHDGLGFVPPMMDHLHGSTAIAGLAYFPPALGIEPLADQMLSGNVMTSRINRTSLRREGATVHGEPAADFMTSDDPWFRPVDLRLGPDGHIYVADFYNRIIGHYEVPLEHPQRDRHRGRIWQIRRIAESSAAQRANEPESLASLNLPASGDSLDRAALLETLGRRLGDRNPERRNLALQAVANRHEPVVRDAVRQLASDRSHPFTARISALWCLYRWREIDETTVRSMAEDSAPQLRTHLHRMLGEWLASPHSPPAEEDRKWVLELSAAALEDSDANVVRAAAEALGRGGAAAHLHSLLSLLVTTDPSDTILRQTVRIALRDILAASDANSEFLQSWQLDREPGGLTSELAQIALGLDSESAGQFLVAYLQIRGRGEPQAGAMLKHASATLAVENLGGLITVAKQLAKVTEFDEAELLEQITAARRTDRGPIAEPLQRWAVALVERELALASRPSDADPKPALHWRGESGTPWPMETRRTPEGRAVLLTSSFPLGETTTDVLHSEAFAAPAKVEFWIAGHNGRPDEDDHRLNRIELVLADSGQILHVALPPRRDTVERIHWDCRAVEGRPVRIRCTDGESGSGYAWIAFGGFTPEQLEPNGSADPLDRALEMIVSYRLKMLRKPLVALAEDGSMSEQRRISVAEVIARLDDDPRLAALLSTAASLSMRGNPLVEPAVVASWVEAAIAGDTLDYGKELAVLCRSLSTADQHHLARRLAANRETASLLVEGIDAGYVAPDVLTDKEVESGLETIASDAMRDRIEELRRRATATDNAVAEVIEQVIEQTLTQLTIHNTAQPTGTPLDLDRGRVLFTKQCAVCHQIAGQGQIVGPQLDGIGNRDARRLLEDILKPDLNVDRAFRTTTLLTVDGAVLTGLVRNADESEVTLTAANGTLSTIASDDIEVRREGTASLMPSNFHETLTSEELACVVAYLQQHAQQK